jgi:phosphate transport system permease protein
MTVAAAIDQMTPREIIRRTSQKSGQRRQLLSNLYFAVLTIALLVIFIPLYGVLSTIVVRGYHSLNWTFLTANPIPPTSATSPIGGVANAIDGTLEVTGIAVLLAVPLTILISVALFETRNRLARIVEQGIEVFVGMPAITFGLFIAAITVSVTHKFEAWYGSMALLFIVVPVATVNMIAAIRSVPQTLIEAGLGLGARPSRVMMRIILPTALPRILTGFFLSVSRALGETAPVLFVIGGVLVPSFNPRLPATTLPTQIYAYFGSQFESQVQACWGMALLLVIIVLFFNVLSRIFLARSKKANG